MNANQLNQFAQNLDALRRDFAQHRVEMALRMDDLERRLSAAEAALPRSGGAGLAQPLPSSTRAPTLASGLRPAVSGSHPAGTGFAEHRRQAHPPPPINRASAASPGFAPPSYPATPYRYPQQPARSAARPPRKVGSGENAAYLPFAIEKIASASQKKSAGDNRTCACGRPTFDMKCFREHHFDWCLLHQRPIVQGLHNCTGRDHRDCQPIHWERHGDWEVIVKTSLDSGHLGTRGVKDLCQVLFPVEIYPEKYQGSWYVG